MSRFCTYNEVLRRLVSVQSEENKTFLRKGCLEMIHEIQDKVTEMMNFYKQNPTFPLDFYNLSLREPIPRS
jgi:hypothetical protein